mmetsp:Transcript_11339/g.24427  ORF Transcript_11339/g.24427 Transcript_11339/m.24427 type:complete len:166 (+) Transcript_11339:71-568(+)
MAKISAVDTARRSPRKLKLRRSDRIQKLGQRKATSAVRSRHFVLVLQSLLVTWSWQKQRLDLRLEKRIQTIQCSHGAVYNLVMNVPFSPQDIRVRRIPPVRYSRWGTGCNQKIERMAHHFRTRKVMDSHRQHVSHHSAAPCKSIRMLNERRESQTNGINQSIKEY